MHHKHTCSTCATAAVCRGHRGRHECAEARTRQPTQQTTHRHRKKRKFTIGLCSHKQQTNAHTHAGQHLLWVNHVVWWHTTTMYTSTTTPADDRLMVRNAVISIQRAACASHVQNMINCECAQQNSRSPLRKCVCVRVCKANTKCVCIHNPSAIERVDECIESECSRVLFGCVPHKSRG